jgi:CRP/FNR family nitrogen fixation transcriptional regulator
MRYSHMRAEGRPETMPALERASSRSGFDVSRLPVAACMRFARNTEIFGEDDRAEYLYTVRTGAVRGYKLLSDGRRQIEAFYLAGDVFGITAGDRHHCSAEAVVNSSILLVKRSTVEALAARDPQLARSLWISAAERLEQAQEHLLLLGRKNAHERLAAFLLDMADRCGAARSPIELPMSRQDIADYLGLTIETVSRMLTDMANTAMIELPSSRRVLLRDAAALSRINC